MNVKHEIFQNVIVNKSHALLVRALTFKSVVLFIDGCLTVATPKKGSSLNNL